MAAVLVVVGAIAGSFVARYLGARIVRPDERRSQRKPTKGLIRGPTRGGTVTAPGHG